MTGPLLFLSLTHSLTPPPHTPTSPPLSSITSFGDPTEPPPLQSRSQSTPRDFQAGSIHHQELPNAVPSLLTAALTNI